MPNQKQAYNTGKILGEDFVRANADELSVPDEYGELPTPEGVAHATFEHYQQFSPWEVTASSWNNTGEARAEGLWAAFERGLEVGARKAARALR